MPINWRDKWLNVVSERGECESYQSHLNSFGGGNAKRFPSRLRWIVTATSFMPLAQPITYKPTSNMTLQLFAWTQGSQWEGPAMFVIIYVDCVLRNVQMYNLWTLEVFSILYEVIGDLCQSSLYQFAVNRDCHVIPFIKKLENVRCTIEWDEKICNGCRHFKAYDLWQSVWSTAKALLTFEQIRKYPSGKSTEIFLFVRSNCVVLAYLIIEEILWIFQN